MKAALVQPPVWWTVDPPLGLAQIAGCLKHHGHEVFVFDLNILLWKDRLKKYESLWGWEQFHFWNQPEFVSRFFAEHEALVSRYVESILRTDAPVIGLSVHNGSHLAALEIARRIKAGDKRRKIVLGGQYFFFGDKVKEMLSESCVDAVVCGEGDESFPELIRRLDCSGSIEPLPGVWIKRAGGLISGGEPIAIRNLDRVPFADFTGFPMELYTDPERLPIAASRGCVWQCRFCSARAFWSGYRYMGGERIFAEVLHHRKLYPPRGHVEFYDITANGDVKALHRFSRLWIDEVTARPARATGWKINAIIRPEMTPEVLRDLRKANCHDIIYGIESGSPRLLKAMNKGFVVPVAEEVLRNTRAAGIVTVGNFMFGFPGETEEDFAQTLEFLRRNHASFSRVYASATFTSLEEKSYLKDHQKDFGIKEVPPERFHNLYWESDDGANTYPVRLERYKRFRALAISLGIDAYKGVNGSLEQDHLANLAQYHHYAGKPFSAVANYLDYLDGDLYHDPTHRHLAEQRPALDALLRAQKALTKANLLAEAVPEAEAIGRDVERQVRDGAGVASILAECKDRKGEAFELARFLARAWCSLKSLPGQSFRISWEGGSFVLYWSQEKAPGIADLRALRSRMDLHLRLAEVEIRRGEDRKPAPACVR
ncbi:MAG TPA: radical SAM protein [Elusimicrobiota bacterium]|nr:radical SAM protein [Elusimicrobiota bacterium]